MTSATTPVCSLTDLLRQCRSELVALEGPLRMQGYWGAADYKALLIKQIDEAIASASSEIRPTLTPLSAEAREARMQHLPVGVMVSAIQTPLESPIDKRETFHERMRSLPPEDDIQGDEPTPRTDTMLRDLATQCDVQKPGIRKLAEFARELERFAKRWQHIADQRAIEVADLKTLHSASRPSVTDAMVNRFLSWPLPKSVCSDGCVTNPEYPHPRCGTNLLTEVEARQMLEHVLGK